MFWNAASPETEGGNKLSKGYKVNGFIQDPLFFLTQIHLAALGVLLFPHDAFVDVSFPVVGRPVPGSPDQQPVNISTHHINTCPSCFTISL